MSSVITVVVVLAFKVFVSLNRSNGLMLDGHRLSSAESRKSQDEISQLFECFSSENPDFDHQIVETEIGFRFKEILSRRSRQVNSFESQCEPDVLQQSLSKVRLSSAAGRKKSRADIQRYIRAITKYFGAIDETTAEVDSFFASIDYKSAGWAESEYELSHKELVADTAVMNAAIGVVDFAERYPPKIQKGVLRFSTPELESKFRDRLNQVDRLDDEALKIEDSNRK